MFELKASDKNGPLFALIIRMKAAARQCGRNESKRSTVGKSRNLSMVSPGFSE
jgi:hypothetical protein